jgi:PAS domain S-box-containing protein
MTSSRKTNNEVLEENIRLRAQVAQLEDRLDHLFEHGASARAAHEWESLHQVVMSAVADAVLITDDAGRLTYVSPNVQFTFGRSQAEVLQLGRIDSLLPSGLFDPDLLEQRGEVTNLECRIRDSLGRSRELLISVRRVDIRGGTRLYSCRDIGERKKLEKDVELSSLTLERRVEERTLKLRESSERFRRLVEGMRNESYFYATDAQGVITYVSPSIHAILGYTPDEHIGHNWREYIDPESPHKNDLEQRERLRFAGLHAPLIRVPVKHANGETRWLECHDAPVFDSEGRVIGNEGIARDVTHHQQAEDALRRAHEELEHRVQERTAELTAMYEKLRDSEQRYRSVVEDDPEFIVRWQGDGVRTFVNEAYCKYMNATREELIGSSFMPTIVEEDRVKVKKTFESLSVENPVVIDEQRVVLPDGRVVWQHWSNRALFNENGELIEYQAVGSDVTERRKLEEHSREQAVAQVQLRTLSLRERDVLKLVVTGDANKVIARKLALSVKTIEKHRSSMMKKLGVRSVPELVRLALLAEESEDY